MKKVVELEMFPAQSLADFRLAAEREYFMYLLDLYDGNLGKIAVTAGLRRRNTHEKLMLLGFSPSPEFIPNWGGRHAEREIILRWGGIATDRQKPSG